MRKFFIIIILFFPLASFAGELDGKGLVCGPVGYYFDHGEHSFHEVENGVLFFSDLGEYSTTPENIYAKNKHGNTSVISRNYPRVEYEYVKYACEITVGYSSFLEMLKTNIENITKDNKI
jgi:hypothetical protein